MFPEVDIQEVIRNQKRELLVLVEVIQKFSILYASTVNKLWRDKYYQSSIALERIWNTSPIHTEFTTRSRYVYELENLGNGNYVTETDKRNARETPLSVFGYKKPMMKCVFHNDKTASLHITKNKWYCHGCSQGGDTIGFIMRTKHLPFLDAVRFINGI